jgi:hypothetical protein
VVVRRKKNKRLLPTYIHYRDHTPNMHHYIFIDTITYNSYRKLENS